MPFSHKIDKTNKYNHSPVQEIPKYFRNNKVYDSYSQVSYKNNISQNLSHISAVPQ